jgi:hypothetical protein
LRKRDFNGRDGKADNLAIHATGSR